MDEFKELPEESAIPEPIARTAKIIGGAVMSGVAGYAAAKGIDTFIIPDVDPKVVYEATVATGSAVLGGFVTAIST